jgi:hypothetical protein
VGLGPGSLPEPVPQTTQANPWLSVKVRLFDILLSLYPGHALQGNIHFPHQGGGEGPQTLPNGLMLQLPSSTDGLFT